MKTLKVVWFLLTLVVLGAMATVYYYQGPDIQEALIVLIAALALVGSFGVMVIRTLEHEAERKREQILKELRHEAEVERKELRRVLDLVQTKRVDAQKILEESHSSFVRQWQETWGHEKQSVEEILDTLHSTRRETEDQIKSLKEEQIKVLRNAFKEMEGDLKRSLQSASKSKDALQNLVKKVQQEVLTKAGAEFHKREEQLKKLYAQADTLEHQLSDVVAHVQDRAVDATRKALADQETRVQDLLTKVRDAHGRFEEELFAARKELIQEMNREFSSCREMLQRSIQNAETAEGNVSRTRKELSALVDQAEELKQLMVKNRESMEVMAGKGEEEKKQMKEMEESTSRLALLLSRLTWWQLVMLSEADRERISNIEEIAVEDLNRVLAMVIPDRQKRNEWIKELDDLILSKESDEEASEYQRQRLLE